MKNFKLLVILLLLAIISCGGLKKTTREDDIINQPVEKIPVQETVQADIQEPPKTENILVDTVQTENSGFIENDSTGTSKKIIVNKPKFSFISVPGYKYDLYTSPSLRLILNSNVAPDAHIVYEIEAGNLDTLFSETAMDSVVMYTLAKQEVADRIGTGNKQFMAYFITKNDTVVKKFKLDITDSSPVEDVVETDSSIVADTVSAVVVNDSTIDEETDKIKLIENLAFNDIYFDNGVSSEPSSKLSSDYHVTLGKIVKVLQAEPEVRILLTGYSDSAGKKETNRILAMKRANTIARLITDMFSVEDRKDISSRIEIRSLGEENAIVKSGKPSQRALMRRVSLQFTYDSGKGFVYSDSALKINKTKKVKKSPKPKLITKKAKRAPSEISSEEKLYNKGTDLFKQNSFDEAIQFYNEIITLDPKNEFADNAQWWIGESLYNQGKYHEALEAFIKVFGLGNKNKEAYAQLRIGYCYYQMKNNDQALKEFQKVITNYPKNKEEVRKAQSIIKRIK